MDIKEEKMYYYKNHHIYNYYCCYNNINFKTETEYRQYLAANNIPTEVISYLRKQKYARCDSDWAMGEYIAYEVSPGTLLYDERDFSHYYFDNEGAAENFIKSYYMCRDGYADRAFFQGYPGDDSESIITYHEPVDIASYITTFEPDKQNIHFAHFIISYMPNDEKLRKIRMNAHKLQIRNIKMITPNAKIYIIAQNYKDSEYINDPQITYKKFPKGIGAGKARNTALKWLYDSDYDFGIINDDDIYLKPNNSAINFFKDLEINSEEFINSPMDFCLHIV